MTRRRRTNTASKHWSAGDAPEARSRPLEAWRALDAAPVDEIGVEESKEERPPTPPLFDPIKLPPTPPRPPPASPPASPAPAAAEAALAAVVVGDVRCSGCVDVASRALESAGLFVERYEADFAKATATFHLLRPAAASAVDAALEAAGVERGGVAFPAPASLAGVVEALLAGGAVRRYACRCGCASCLCADRPVDPSDAGTVVTLEGLCERLEDRGMGDGLRAEVLAEVLRAQGAPAAALLDGWRGRRVPCGCADGPAAREVTGSEAASRLSAWSAAACAAAAAAPEVTASSEAGTWSVASEKSALASERSGPAAAAASSAATTPSAAASSACPTPSAAGEPAAPAPEPGHLRQPSEISVVSGVTEASFSGHLRRPSEPNSGDSGDSAAAVAEEEARVTASEAGTFASLPSDPADAAASEAGTWTIASLPPEAEAPERGHRRGPSEVSFVSGVTEASLDAPFPAPAPRPAPDAWVTPRSKRRHRSAAALAALAPPAPAARAASLPSLAVAGAATGPPPPSPASPATPPQATRGDGGARKARTPRKVRSPPKAAARDDDALLDEALAVGRSRQRWVSAAVAAVAVVAIAAGLLPSGAAARRDRCAAFYAVEPEAYVFNFHTKFDPYAPRSAAAWRAEFAAACAPGAGSGGAAWWARASAAFGLEDVEIPGAPGPAPDFRAAAAAALDRADAELAARARHGGGDAAAREATREARGRVAYLHAEVNLEARDYAAAARDFELVTSNDPVPANWHLFAEKLLSRAVAERLSVGGPSPNARAASELCYLLQCKQRPAGGAAPVVPGASEAADAALSDAVVPALAYLDRAIEATVNNAEAHARMARVADRARRFVRDPPARGSLAGIATPPAPPGLAE